MSTLPLECEQLLISGYVLGDLSPGEAQLFAEMLAENPDLIEQVTAMQQALEQAHNPPEVSPPVDLRDRILAAADAQKTESVAVKRTPETAETAEVTTSTRSRLLGILGAIALFTIAALGITNYRLWRMAKSADVVETATNQKTYFLKSDNPSETATAKLIVDSNRANATLIADNLPALPPEKAYALWTVVGKDVPYTTDEKGAILTAVFQVDRGVQVNQGGNFTREIALPQPHLKPKTIKKIAITVEDVSAPQEHQGSIFISTQ